ncbi:MAG: cobalamin-dependent protein [Deltaproteobacteria bacterium]|nr:cobalamin-dependent protein [Deltaproteobacteria bacterium]MBW2343156.1 cobalamin-dependent protein [Deltaproteobacteria bacterium]
MDKRKKIKVVVSMIGLDDHSVGGVVVSSILRNAGIEVVYLGTYQTPEMIVQAAIQEDVDAIGISSHASNYSQIGELMDLLREKDMDDILVICGGTIPKKQIPRLKEKGVAEVFTPQSTSESIVNYIFSNVSGANGGSNK